MNFIIICFLCLLIPTVFSTYIFNDKVLLPLTSVSRIVRPGSATAFSQPSRRPDLPKIIFLKHLLELECLKEFYNQSRPKNRSVPQKSDFRSPEGIRPPQSTATQSDGSKKNLPSDLYWMKGSPIKSEPIDGRKHIGNERILLESQNHSLKQSTYQHRQQPKPNLKPTRGQILIDKADTKKMGNAAAENTPLNEATGQREGNVALPKAYSKVDKSRETDGSKSAQDNSRASVEDYNFPMTVSFGDDKQFSKFSQQLGKQMSTSHLKSNSHSLWQSTKSHHMQPYEIEEIIEENLRVDLSADKDQNLELEDRQFFGGEKEKDVKKAISIEDEKPKMINDVEVIDNSISSILKGLISPVVKVVSSTDEGLSVNDRDHKKKISDIWSPHQKTSTKAEKASAFSRFHSAFPNHQPVNDDGSRKDFSDSNSYSRHTLGLNPQQKWNQQVAQSRASPRLLYTWGSSKATTKRTTNTETYTPSVFLKTRKQFFLSDTLNDLRQKTTAVPKKLDQFSSTPLDLLGGYNELDLSYVLKGLHTGNTNVEDVQTSPIPVISQHILKNTRILSKNETPSTLSSILGTHPSENNVNKISSTPSLSPEQNFLTPHPIRTDFSEIPSTNSFDSSSTSKNFPKTAKYITEANLNEEDVTNVSFKDFTDDPIKIDLLDTTFQSDSSKVITQDSNWKNSRKMHFEVLQEAKSRKTNFSEAEQRRSDILISENLNDYTDNENKVTSLNYLDKLKQNVSSFGSDILANKTIDAVIPLIPTVINDLRDGKISREEKTVLSNVFGKYWPYILVLSNDTNFDLLPLLKMKDEKDLENVLQNFILEDSNPITTEKSEESDSSDSLDYVQSYDYMEEYKDLYEDMLAQELDPKRKRLRPRRHEQEIENDWKSLEATREYFESIAEEQIDEGNDYVYEDIMYDSLEDDSSVFELMEIADLHFNIKNVTSRPRQK